MKKNMAKIIHSNFIMTRSIRKRTQNKVKSESKQTIMGTNLNLENEIIENLEKL